MPSLDQTLSVQGLSEAKAAVADFASSGSASFKQLGEAARHAGGDQGAGAFGASLNQLVGLMTGVKGEVGDIGESFRSFGEIINALAPALQGLAGVASLAGLYELAASATESARQIQNMATAVGASTEEFEGFQFAIASVGGSVETANGSITKMLAFLGQTDDALKKVSDSSAALAAQQKVAAESANLSVASASNAAVNSANAYNQSRQAITAAKVAVDKAAISYTLLYNRVKDSNATGQQAQINATQLRDAQTAVSLATQNVTNAQTRSSQALNDLSLASTRASIAQDQRLASLLKLDEEQDKGTTSVQKWLESLGVASATMTEASTNGTEAFYKIIQGLSQISSAATRADYARAVFGRGWIALVPAIAAGGDKLAAFAKEFEETGLGLEEGGFQAASAFQKASAQLSFFVEAVRNYLGTKIADIFAPIIQATADFIAKNSTQIKEWADGFAQALNITVEVVKLIASVISSTIVPVLNGVIAIANELARDWNDVFGTEIHGSTLIFLALIGTIAGRFIPVIAAVARFAGAMTGLGPLVRGVYTAVALLAGTTGIPALAAAINLVVSRAGLIGALAALLINLWENWDSYWPNIKAAAQGFWELVEAIYGWFVDTWTQVGELVWGKIVDAFNNVKTYLGSWIDWFNGIISSVTEFFSNAWQSSVSFVENLWNGLVDWAKGVATAIYNYFKPVFDFIQSLANLISGVNSSGAAGGAGSATGWHGGEVRAAGGGRIIGPGTATSDSIPALLSNGEFVINQGAASRVGYGFLHALNSGMVAMRSIGGAVRMALGGMAGSAQRFATGGLAVAGSAGGGMSEVHLHLGGSTYSLLGEKGVVQALTGAARKAAITSTGKAPSWKR